MLTFQSKKQEKSIVQKGEHLFKKRKIPQKALLLGEKYRSAIENEEHVPFFLRKINSAVGMGLFSKDAMEKDTFIGEYSGVVRKNIREYFTPLNNYCYRYPIEDEWGRDYVIDASQGGPCKWMNHSFSPNVKPEYAFFDGLYHVIFLSLRKIKKHEQLLYDYGPSYWYVRQKPQKL